MAWIGAVLIGIALGLFGSGGSIVTVPVLVYLVGQPEKVAIAGSLAIVGAVAGLGALSYLRRGMIDWRSVLWFGVPGILGTVGGAWLAEFVSGRFQLAVFALVMLVAAYGMLRKRATTAAVKARARWKIIVDGIAVGALTGFVGVGGGFLIIPALILLGGLNPVIAVGTSLGIIALKSLAGFAKYLSVLDRLDMSVDWTIIGIFILLGGVGSVFGGWLGRRLPAEVFRKAFAALLLIVAAVILVDASGLMSSLSLTGAEQ
ncbi:MAG: sulfite exporter TauE/SafE family protein [Wenzhouxiangella sp.]|nr:sulfite exporter TauE/SafE family protein [Wenzhouxiangella sp.]